jgi:type IV pilus assembly protein PilO
MNMEIPADSRLARQMQKYAKMQYAIAGTLLLGLAAHFVFVYRPQSTQLADLNQQITQRRAELDSDRSQTNRLPRVASELEQLKARLANFKQLPAGVELGEFTNDIHAISLRTGLPEPTVVPGPARSDRLFSEQPIELSLQGNFSKVFNFIRQIEDMPRLTHVRDVSIKSVGDAGEVEATLSVIIYYGEE